MFEQVLVLDAGDALVGSGRLGSATEGKAIVAGMNLMGYDAMAVGPNELALGLGVLRQRMAEAEFAMLSANAVVSATGELLADPYLIVPAGGHRIGIIGLTRPPATPLPGVRVIDPGQAAAEYVTEVAGQADVVVLLTNLPHRAALDLARSVPGIDLVIAALPDEQPVEATREPDTGTLVLAADLASPGHSGRRVGVLSATVRPDGSLAEESWESRWIDPALADDSAMDELLASFQ